MFQQAGTAQLNDYFRPLSERGGSRVFFCRIAGYGETVAAFLRRYYEAARRSGVIIDGRIPNPTPDNLSYFNEMMGSGFQMDRDFLSQRLKKWLPRMTDGQRDAVVTAMYATLDDMRENAGVRYSSRYFDRLDAGKFYTKLLTLRTQLSAANTDTGASAGTDTAPQS